MQECLTHWSHLQVKKGQHYTLTNSLAEGLKFPIRQLQIVDPAVHEYRYWRKPQFVDGALYPRFGTVRRPMLVSFSMKPHQHRL
ncbi:hypothetical protein GCM10008949_43950 [Deinococcus humi]|nr:hypothetical protein GCM10008949_43950 [Deinococcus humi]